MERENFKTGSDRCAELLEKQLKYSKITAFALLALLAAIVIMMFFAGQIYTKLDAILTEFAAVDWSALADKVDSLDLKTLNEAISDFSGLISPLAKFFGVK